MNNQLEKTANTPLDHIHTIGKVTKILANICSICILVGACLTLVSGIFLCCIPNNAVRFNYNVDTQVDINDEQTGWWSTLVDGEAFGSFQVGDTTVRLFDAGLVVRNETESFTVTTQQFGGALICLAIGLFLFSGVFSYISRFGKTLNAVSSPFTMECVSALKKVAIAVLVWSIGGAIVNGVSDVLLRDGAQFLQMATDGGSILLALALLGFAYIFQYGVSLQQQADTTL